MIPGPLHAGWLGPASLVALFGLLTAGWLAWPAGVPALYAAPAAQAQPSPLPRPTATPAPVAPPDEQLQAAQLRKTREEIRLIGEQIDRLRQQQEIDSQVWRAPAAAVAAFGPTMVGLGLLYLLARALSHWLGGDRARAEPAEVEDDEEEI